MDSIRDWLPLVTALVAVGIQWGMQQATLRAFRREVDELRRLVDKLTSVEMRVALLEQTVRRLDEVEIPKIEKDTATAIADVRREVSECRNTRTPHD